jgi:outer membrane protein assembly factor BamC
MPQINMMAQFLTVNSNLKRLGVLITLALLTGCSALGIDEALPDQRLIYKQQREAGVNLEIPPDLAGSTFNDALDMPASGSATFSQYSDTRTQQQPQTAAASAVLPTTADVALKRTADSRWLEVQTAPQQVWPKLVAFWREQGILLVEQNPAVGLMRTDWLDNRAEIRKDFVTRMMSKVIAGAYSTGNRDQYSIQIEESTRSGATDIHLHHRGMTEKLRNTAIGDVGQTIWEPSGSDAAKEAEMLRRLMVFLGGSKTVAQAVTANAGAASTAPSAASRAKLVTENGVQQLALTEELRSAWRLTGSALDRAGFAVEDRDQTHGLFYVRYAGKDDAEKSNQAKPSWGSRLAFWRKNEIDSIKKYQIQVTGTATESRVSVLDANGKPEQSASGRRILVLLQEQMR